MATVVTLDSIREAAEKKYGSYDIELGGGNVVRLLNPLRLSESARNRLAALEEREEQEGGDDTYSVAERLHETVRIIAESPEQAAKLIEAVNGDLGVLATIIEQYGDAAEVGEASPSQG